ncbi:SnoaL-like polyketide cyclase [Micromonospora rhizosphaerae]|uniref:SnoaL-like polyketide cyclase n=1 Tax=Micromonospora rhizosphaerae TaxID=568872 RepID=A0A1C6SBY6_9ACTN|nr:nuclear transport factor 2 family protein [Micromonospora rhizosphaerae]SCL26990.1 SnoaL-like polyketide cyclase [Micromonospora rhizosphaerae]
MELKQIVPVLLDAYNNHSPTSVAPCYCLDATHLDVATGRPRQGRDAIVAGLGFFLRAFPDAMWHVESTAVTAQHAAVRYRLTGSLQADFGPYTAHGQPLELPGVLWLTAGERAIGHSADYWDAASFNRQMQST